MAGPAPTSGTRTWAAPAARFLSNADLRTSIAVHSERTGPLGWQLPRPAPFRCAAVSSAIARWRSVPGSAGSAALDHRVLLACAGQAPCNYPRSVIGRSCCANAAERVRPRVNPGELAVLRQSVVTSHGP